MSSSSPIGSIRLLASLLLVLLLAATAASAANVGTPVKGAAHAIAAMGRQLVAAPEPSRKMGKKKRSAKTRRTKGRNDYSQFLCPNKADACPVVAPGETLAAVKKAELKVLADWFKAGFDCIDTQTELVSCGGCTSLGLGQDCTVIPHAAEIGCDKGVCVVSKCDPGFTLAKDGRHCIKRAPAANPAPAAR